MPPADLRSELLDLKKDIDHLATAVERLQLAIQAGDGRLLRSVAARGITLYRKNPWDELLISPGWSAKEKSTFYRLLKRYSFRLLLRDVIRMRHSFSVADLTRYCSPEAAQTYVSTLRDLGSVEAEGGDQYHLTCASVASFGPTLEWFVAEIFRREFASPAFFGVRFRGTRAGGDYDLIANWLGHLVYVEIKSSPPRGIENTEIQAFLCRVGDLLPDIAIFFNDTQLRMKDKIVPMFDGALEARARKSGTRVEPVHRLVDELFQINHGIYIVNSKKDVVTNFETCLRDFLLVRKSPLFPAGHPWSQKERSPI
jgi:hypothetical protein